MECSGKRYILHGSRTDKFTIWNLSDLHLMSKSCAEDLLARDIKRIKEDPHAFWIGGGDYADYIGFHDKKRFDPDCVPDKVKVSDLGKLGKVTTELVRDTLKPIAGKCLGLVFGNHEALYQRVQEQQHLHSWLCEELGVPNLGYSALMDVVFQRTTGVKAPRLEKQCAPENRCHSTTKRLFCHHGAGAACTAAGKLKRLEDFMDMYDADLFFVGHVHDKIGRRKTILSADGSCTKLVAKDKLGVISGSYLKTYTQGVTSYGEQRGYRPTTLGAAWIEITPETGEMRGEL